MITFELVENYVYEIDINTRKLIGNIKKIDMPAEIKVNTTELVQIPVQYEEFITDVYVINPINKEVEVYLNGSLQGTTEIVNGIGNIEFVSAEAGTFTITVENASCEVIVS